MSISSKFFAQILRQKNTKQNVTREKLLNSLSDEKCARKMLIELTPVKLGSELK